MDEAEFGVDDISENEYNKLKEKIMPKKKFYGHKQTIFLHQIDLKSRHGR